MSKYKNSVNAICVNTHSHAHMHAGTSSLCICISTDHTTTQLSQKCYFMTIVHNKTRPLHEPPADINNNHSRPARIPSLKRC